VQIKKSIQKPTIAIAASMQRDKQCQMHFQKAARTRAQNKKESISSAYQFTSSVCQFTALDQQQNSKLPARLH
jgi:hypothetical protein